MRTNYIDSAFRYFQMRPVSLRLSGGKACTRGSLLISKAIKGGNHMKPVIACVAMTIALLSFAFGESEQESTDKKTEQEIRQQIEKYHTALLQRDIPVLEKIWADDYVFVNAVGDILTKAQRLANIKSARTTLESLNDEEDITVRVYQNSAVATSRLTIKGQYSGQSTSGQYRSTHVWVKGPAGWQLVSNQLTALAPK
jgi:ketosteroid isomerase-like protein